ncbi:MAG: hypothetical protein R3C55_12315 [Parvularculaceae bacterium]
MARFSARRRGAAPGLVVDFADKAHELPIGAALFKGVWMGLSTGFQSSLGDATLDRLRRAAAWRACCRSSGW